MYNIRLVRKDCKRIWERLELLAVGRHIRISLLLVSLALGTFDTKFHETKLIVKLQGEQKQGKQTICSSLFW